MTGQFNYINANRKYQHNRGQYKTNDIQSSQSRYLPRLDLGPFRRYHGL